jgi:hypothetical protein
MWEQELADAGYFLRPTFEELEAEDWYDELWKDEIPTGEDSLNEEEATNTSDPLIRTFGRKTYNLANPDELNAWVTANFEFQQKRYPDKYRNNGSINSRWLRLRANIARNLLATLEAEGVTNPQVIDRLQRIIDTGTKLSNYFTNDELNELFSEFVLKLSAKLPEKKLAAVRKKLDSIKQDLINVMND